MKYSNGFKLKLVLIMIAIIGSVSLSAAYQYKTITYTNVTIESKERISTGSGDTLSHKYLIFGESSVFENTDALLHGKFDSSTMQAKIKVGNKYRVKTYGWRVPFLSWYKNIIEVEEL